MLTVRDVQQATRRDDLVPGYADGIRQTVTGDGWPDVAAVNAAIEARWSRAALHYIKDRAWKAVRGAQ